MTAICTSLLGSRSRSVRTSRLPFLLAHSIFLATPSFMICCAMESFFCSSAFSSALPGATGFSSAPSAPVAPICSRAASAFASAACCCAATFSASSSSCADPP